MTRERRAHWLAPLKRDKMPTHHAVIDTEATIVSRAGRYEHRWLCGHCVGLRLDDDERFSQTVSIPSASAKGMWETLIDPAEQLGQLVVWAHNLPYDLRVSEAMRHLLAAGWRCEAISLARVSAWSSWRKGKKKLLVCDSYAWLHAPLAKIGREMGRAALAPLDLQREPERAPEKCRYDAELLAEIVARLLNMIVRESLGPLRPTGAGQSHAAWRRRWLQPKSVLVHDNHEVLAIERQAMHTGRCEAWKWGEQPGALYEHDLNLAYCRIAAAHPLPVKLIGETAPNDAAAGLAALGEYAVMAEVEISTDLPLVPVQHDGRVLWPVGEFATVLWDPELQLLADCNADVKVRRAWLYKTGDALMPMSRWLIDRLDPGCGEIDPVERRLLKHWARTLVGRCALRYSQWEFFGRSPWDCLELSFELTPDLKDAIAHLQVGHTNFERTAEREANNSCPAIPGWVQSRCRVILWQLTQTAGPENVAYLDTDGLLVNSAGSVRLGGRGSIGPDWILAEKGRHHPVAIHGPRQVEIGPDRRIAGLPKNAIRVSEITWDGELWEGFEQALAAGHHDHVGVMPATWEITPTDHRRKHLPDGATEPWRVP